MQEDRLRMVVDDLPGGGGSTLLTGPPTRDVVPGGWEHGSAEGARRDTVITTEEAGLLIPVFALTARIGLLNNEADVAAELCEAVAAVGLALRSSPPTASTAVLRRGAAWAGLVVELVEAGAWTADSSPSPAAGQDAIAIDDVRADLDLIAALLDPR